MIRYKILIVDDEPGILAMLRDYFEFHGYIVYTAMSGMEALKAVNAKPDLILLDINMPDMDGLEVCKLIRSHVSCPIIFLTARIEAHLRRENRALQTQSAKFFDSLAINYASRQVTYLDKPIPFTKKEFDIVELLTKNPGVKNYRDHYEGSGELQKGCVSGTKGEGPEKTYPKADKACFLFPHSMRVHNSILYGKPFLSCFFCETYL